MRALAEVMIASIDLVRAEVRAGRRAALKWLMVLLALSLVLVIGGIFLLFGLGLILTSLFTAMDNVMPSALALLLTGLAALLAAAGCAWVVLRNVDDCAKGDGKR